ncbi:MULTISPECIES: cobalt ECF transporter T component CbiQ [unclassified Yoonia]|uniref:cobalt ECF transporter T component CbiQ n=1 Tax=unclassified Yoonia TaxID=2629118 RepID=UPI002AFF8FEA|nr:MULTISPECIES: cobalt ECF transporter T component CbiQ [unclassified Yoonia]
MRADPITDSRLRIVAVMVLAFTFSALHGAIALALMVALTLTLIWLSAIPPARLLRALRLPGLVVAGLVIMLPFTSGDTILATLGPLTLRAEGLAAASGIALRFLSIFALIITFLSPLPLPHLINALRGLRLPALLIDMALLTLRHMTDIRHDLSRMQTAMRLRGGQARWFGQLRQTGWILASLLLRSHARSERVYHAMILRGHGAPGAALPEAPAIPRADKIALTAIFALAAGLLAVEHLL